MYNLKFKSWKLEVTRNIWTRNTPQFDDFFFSQFPQIFCCRHVKSSMKIKDVTTPIESEIQLSDWSAICKFMEEILSWLVTWQAQLTSQKWPKNSWNCAKMLLRQKPSRTFFSYFRILKHRHSVTRIIKVLLMAVFCGTVFVNLLFLAHTG